MRAFEGRVIAVDVVGDVEIVRHPGAVAIVPVADDGAVTLVRQTRVPTGRRLVELPAGTLEDGEAPLEAARRELEEETGLRGGQWRELASFWTTPGFCDERMHLFLATGCESGEARPQDDEDLEVVCWTRAEIESRLDEIEDAKTLAGLLLYLCNAR